MQRIADVELPPQAGDFRLLSRRLVDAINAHGERARFMKGLFASLGFRQAEVYYSTAPRAMG